jgi:hypothetical protein
MEAKTVAKLLVEEVIVIVRFGTPYVIHTDQGVQFESEQNEQPATYNFTSFCKPGQ